MSKDTPRMTPAEASRLLAELCEPATRETMDRSIAVIARMCVSMQDTTRAAVEIPRSDFDHAMGENGPAIIAYLMYSAGMHKEFSEILDRLAEALTTRQLAPPHP